MSRITIQDLECHVLVGLFRGSLGKTQCGYEKTLYLRLLPCELQKILYFGWIRKICQCA